jgi:hypothetical protein
MKAYSIKETNDNGDLVFTPVKSIEANMPYLITTDSDVDNLSAENVTLEATPDEMKDVGNEDFEFRGTLCDISNEDAADMGAYVLTANREWLPVSYDTPERYIKAGSAYLVPITSPKTKVLSLLTTEQGGFEHIIGDVNGDDAINVTDVGMVIDHILDNTPENFIEAAADVNGDGEVNVTDVGLVIDIILSDDEPAGARKLEEEADVDTLDPQ